MTSRNRAIGQLVILDVIIGYLSLIIMRSINFSFIILVKIVVLVLFLAFHLPQFIKYITTNYWQTPPPLLAQYTDKPVGFMILSVAFPVTSFLFLNKWLFFPTSINIVLIVITISILGAINPDLSKWTPYIYLSLILFLFNWNSFVNGDFESVVNMVQNLITAFTIAVYIIYQYQILRDETVTHGRRHKLPLLTLIATLPLLIFVIIMFDDPLVLVGMPLYLLVVAPLIYRWLQTMNVEQIAKRLRIILGIDYLLLIFGLIVAPSLSRQFDLILGNWVGGVGSEAAYFVIFTLILPWPLLLIPTIMIIRKSRVPPEQDIDTVELYPSTQMIEEKS